VETAASGCGGGRRRWRRSNAIGECSKRRSGRQR
jgi:hypothetical protein